MRLTLLLLIILGLNSCYKDIENPTSEPRVIVQEVPRSTYDTGILGTTSDANLGLISGYDLVINTQSYEVTNDNFFFEINNIKKSGQLIEINNQDKLMGLSYHYLLENDINKVRLQTLEGFTEKLIEPGVNYLDNNESMGFEYEGTFIDIDGSEYSNDITLRAVEIIDQSILSTIASSGYLTDGTLVALYPETAYAIAFYSEERRLYNNNSTGSKILTNLPIGKALFVYHREFGYWLELTEENNEFLSDKLDHLVIADYKEAIYLEGTLEFNQQTISYANGMHSDDNDSYDFYSTESGRWAQVLPLSTTINSQILSPCGDIVSSSTNEITNNEFTLELNLNSSVNSIVLNQELIDCNGELQLQPGYIITDGENSSLYTFSDPTEEHRVIVCNESFSVAGYDFTEDSEGPFTEWKTSNANNISTLTSCSDFKDGYSYLKIRDEKEIYPAFTFESENGETTLSSVNENFSFRFKGEMSGSYENQQINVFMNDENFGKDGYKIDCDRNVIGCGMETFEVTHFDKSMDGWLRVSFAGSIFMQTIKNPEFGYFPVSGVILIKV